MFAVVVDFELAPGTMDRFLPLMIENAQSSLRDEPGCLRFDVWTDEATPDAVYLYEIYDSEAAFQAHMQTPHFKAFNLAADGMIAAKTVKTLQSLHK